MKILNDFKKNLYFLIEKSKSNYLFLIIFGGIFIAGFILGLIFGNSFIFIRPSTGELFIIKENGFWTCFFKLFLIFQQNYSIVKFL